ncbi:helix-turn-helix transcriptional regulator [Flindersiella endophytica]
MTEPTELGRYLRARRERVRPGDVGLPSGTGVRRTPGLRREELATLAGVSADYYTRLERGRETNPSPAVLFALARVLRLDGPETDHLLALAEHAARGGRNSLPRRDTCRQVRPTALQLLETVRPNPAYVVSRTNDLLAANPGGLGILPGIAEWPEPQRNITRYVFLHPAARTLWVDWETLAAGAVAHLRAVPGADPDDPALAALVGELTVKSPDFVRMWSRYDVRPRSSGVKAYHHPIVGEMRLEFETMPLGGTDGQRVVIYLAEPGTPDHDAMVLLDLAMSSAESATRER